MTYVRVRVCIDDVLDEVDDDDLLEELNRRRRRRGAPWGEVMQALDDAATILRQQGRIDLAARLDDARVEYIGPSRTVQYAPRFKTGPAKMSA